MRRFRAFVNSLQSESLVGTSWDGKPFGRMVLDDWTWTEDKLQLELHVRKNLTFHDGKPLDNRIVADTLQRVVANKRNQQTAVSYASVTAVETAPDGGVRIRLSRPEALLLADISNTTIADPANEDNGLGPFKLLARTPQVKLAAFDNYYRGRPSIDTIQVAGLRGTALIVGRVDAWRDRRGP